MTKWDSVSVINVARINQTLANNSTQLLNKFDYFDVGSTFTFSYRCLGEFGKWVLNQTSTGNLLRLELPITKGAIISNMSELDLSGMTAVMEVSLNFLPNPNTTSIDLMFSFKNAGQSGNPPQQDFVTPLNLIGSSDQISKLGSGGKDDVLNTIAKFLCSQASALSYIFASLNLVPPSSNSWLTPKNYMYSYNSVGSSDRGFMAICTTVTERSVEGLSAQVDASLIPDASSDMSFAFTRDLFLQHILLPALPPSFGGEATNSNFAFDSHRHNIICSNVFYLDSIKVMAIRYKPRVTDLVINVIPQGISIEIKGDCDLKAGISMTYWVSSSFTLHFDTAAQSMSFRLDKSPVSGHDVDIPLLWIGGGVIVDEIVDAITSAVSHKLGDRLSSRLVEKVGNMIIPCVAWTGITTMQVNNISLDDNFVMRGQAR